MDSIKPIFDLAERFGVAAPVIGLLLWLYWQERSERRELMQKLMDLTKAQIAAEEEMTGALNVLSAKVSR